MRNEIKKHLVELSEEGYREFSAKLIPNVDNVLGVRIPILRRYAKELSKSEGFDVDVFLSIEDNEYLEFVMLQGILLGMKHSPQEVFFEDVRCFVPKIDNWAVCDIFCASLKLTNKYKDETFEFLQSYLLSKEEYMLRFGVVMLLTYYINEKYITKVLEILTALKHDGYYAQMAIAWALSICYVKFFDETHSVVSKADLPFEILRKTVRKVVESLRPTKEQKEFLKLYLKNKLA